MGRYFRIRVVSHVDNLTWSKYHEFCNHAPDPAWESDFVAELPNETKVSLLNFADSFDNYHLRDLLIKSVVKMIESANSVSELHFLFNVEQAGG